MANLISVIFIYLAVCTSFNAVLTLGHDVSVFLLCWIDMPSEGIGILCSNPNSWNTNPSAYRNKTLANVSSAIWQSTGSGSTIWHQTVFLLPRWFSYLYPLQKYKVNGVYLSIFQFRLLTTISHPDPSSSFWTDLPASILSPPTYNCSPPNSQSYAPNT